MNNSKIQRLSLLTYFIISFLGGCKPIQKVTSSNEELSDPIQIAIKDFIRVSNIYKKSQVFYINKRNAVNNENVLIISITKNFTKLLSTALTTVGSTGKMPSRFVEKDGKLFYWWDNDFPLSEEALTVFRKYDLLQDDEKGTIQFPESTLDETQKSAIYYFCKNNFKVNKKIETNRGQFYDQAPEIDCKCDSMTPNIHIKL